MKIQNQFWRSERDSRLWLGKLVRTFEDVASLRQSKAPVRVPAEFELQLRYPAAPRGGPVQTVLN